MCIEVQKKKLRDSSKWNRSGCFFQFTIIDHNRWVNTCTLSVFAAREMIWFFLNLSLYMCVTLHMTTKLWIILHKIKSFSKMAKLVDVVVSLHYFFFLQIPFLSFVCRQNEWRSRNKRKNFMCSIQNHIRMIYASIDWPSLWETHWEKNDVRVCVCAQTNENTFKLRSAADKRKTNATKPHNYWSRCHRSRV